MLPVLVQIGSFKIYTMGVLMALGLFFGLYYWWKLGRDEHYDETSLFDAFFASTITFFVAGRVGYVAQHMDELGTAYRLVAFLRYPGLFFAAGIVGALLMLISLARKNDWDVWKIMDSASVSIALVLIFGALGAFLNGSNPGREMAMGLAYPGVAGLRFPVDLWGVFWFVITFGVTMRVRKNFRFYAWYKGDSSVAKDGLAFFVFGTMMGIYYLVRGLVDDGLIHVGIIPVMSLLGLSLALACILLIMVRSGKDYQSKLIQYIRKHS